MKKLVLCFLCVLLMHSSANARNMHNEGYKNMCDATFDAVSLSLNKKGINEHRLSSELLQKHITDRGQTGEAVTALKDGIDPSLYVNQYLLASIYGLADSDVNVTGMHRISTADREAVKQAVNTYGGVIISYCNTGEYEKGESNSYYSGKGQEDINRQAVIVGWEDSYERSLFGEEPSGEGAWLIKDDFFDGGYAYISYYDESIGGTALALDCDAVSGYDKVYQFDGGYTYDKDVYFGHTGYMCNTFISSRDESLEYVSFFVNTNENVDYEVKIYTNSALRKNPASGYLENRKDEERGIDLSLTGRTTHAGYYTVKLKEPVMLAKDDEFSVAVILKSDENIYLPIDTDGTVKDARGEELLLGKVGSYERQSYISMDGVSWEEISLVGNQNVRIKAFTKAVNSPSGNGKLVGAVIITALLYNSCFWYSRRRRYNKK